MTVLKKLSELCTDIVDCPHSTPNWLSRGIVVLRNFNLVDGFIDTSELYYVDEQTYRERTKRIVPKEGDIIFSREAPVGNCAIVPPNFKCCLGQRLVLLRVNRDLCSPEYLLAMLNSQAVKSQIEQVEKTGSTVSNFNIGDLKDLLIPYVEDFDIQKKITSVYASLMTRIDNNNKIDHDLNTLINDTFKFWFLQHNFPDSKNNPYALNGGVLIEDKRIKTKFPKEWKLGTIGELIKENEKSKIQVNQAAAKQGDIPFFTSGDDVLRYKDYLVDGFNIFMSTGGNSVIKAFYGKAHYSTDTWCINAGDYSAYLYLFLKCINNRINDYFFAGSGLKHLQKEQLRSIFIEIPELTVIKKFNELVMPMFVKKSKIMNENYKLIKIRNYLLPLLISGQVKVSN